MPTTAGGPDDDTGEVTFEAGFTTLDGPGVLREHSRFERRGGRWLYVDGDQERREAGDPSPALPRVPHRHTTGSDHDD